MERQEAAIRAHENIMALIKKELHSPSDVSTYDADGKPVSREDYHLIQEAMEFFLGELRATTDKRREALEGRSTIRWSIGK